MSKNNTSSNQNAAKATKISFSRKKYIFVKLDEYYMMRIGRKGSGAYTKIMGLWGHRWGLSIPEIDLIIGAYRPKKSTSKIFLP